MEDCKMKKKFLVMMSILLLMAMAGSAMAAEGTYIDLSARDVVLSRVSENLGCRFENAKYYCLIKPDGTKLTNEIYTSISAVSSYPFFKVEADSKDGVHDEGLIDDQGNVIVPVMYADVSVVSDRWAYGVKLTPSSGDDKDYTFTNFSTGDKTFYRIDTVDFYYRGKQAGTLSRSDFDGYPTAYGDYICIQNREKKRVYYNSAMEKSPVDGDYGEYTSTYKNRATHYVHNGTGMPAFETGCTLTPAEVEKSIVYENGKFLNLQGEEAFRAAQNYDYFSGFHGDYAVVTMNRMKGLIDAAGQEVIPLEYEEIGNYEDQYLTFGVISAEKDGKFGFLDAAGNVTCPFTYSKDIVSNRGILASIKNLDGTIIVLSGLAGELPEHYSDVELMSDARAFVAKNAEGECSLIDATGETLIPYVDTWSISYNRAATVACYSLGNRTYRIYSFTHDAAVPAAVSAVTPEGTASDLSTEETPAAEGTWTCSNGHAGNTGKFCPECGEAKPEDITCASCGTVYSADSVPNFCPNDGTKLK